MVSLRNLSFSYDPAKPILSGFSMDIPDSSVIALLGESGIGKSTVARILTGINAPDEGSIYLDDRLLVSEDHRYDRKLGLSIQMVYQHPNLAMDPVQKVGDGILELIRYHHFAPRKEERDLLNEIAEAVMLERETLNHLPSQISGGEAQRVALARCLLFSPRLLILDEATSMLDVSTQANVLGLAKRKTLETGCSVLLITHDHALAGRYADKVCLLERP